MYKQAKKALTPISHFQCCLFFYNNILIIIKKEGVIVYKQVEKTLTSIFYLLFCFVLFFSFIPNPTSTLTPFFKEKEKDAVA